jgi:hypothetical protein
MDRAFEIGMAKYGSTLRRGREIGTNARLIHVPCYALE